LNYVDLYEVLGVPQDATLAEIRSAYRRAAQLCHPDRNAGNPRAEARFKALGSAYRVLRQPTLRQAFDREIGLGGAWKPWYGAAEQAEIEPGRIPSPEEFEAMAIQLAASHRWNAARIAARLAGLGCSYQSAWQISWRARYQVLNESLERMTRRDAESRDGGRPVPATARQAAPSHAIARPSGPSPASTPAPALVAYQPSVWATRIRRLRGVLFGIARLLGFEPPRMAREHRKMLQIEYARRQPRPGRG
jgi:curved DNA-binding protein CbpA